MNNTILYCISDEKYRLALDLSMRGILHSMLTGSAANKNKIPYGEIIKIMPKEEVRSIILDALKTMLSILIIVLL